MIKNRLSLFIAAFLIVGFFFLALPEKGYSGGAFFDFGCCTTLEDGGDCVGCESGCATSEAFCNEIGGNFDLSPMSQICEDSPPDQDADCIFKVVTTPGCCLTDSDDCIESSFVDCFDDVVVGEIWFDGVSCSEVPQCQIVNTPIPTLSEWGLIAIAAVLGVVGFMVIRRRKATA